MATKEAVIQASELYRSGGKVLRRVAVDKERLVVERDGYPVAVLVPYSDYELLKRQKAWQEFQALLDEAQPGGARFNEEEVDADVKEAVQEVRHGKRKK